MIEAWDIHKTYRMGSVEVYALRGFSVKINQGEFVALMGPSGSGKSTALHILGLLDTPDRGAYRLAGRDTSGLSDRDLAALRARYIGFVFQQYNLLPRVSALENAGLPLIYSRHPDPASPRELLERVGLGNRLDHPPNKLSGGQQQRVAIARALVNRPPILLADEPTGNLDSESAEEILALLKELHADGLTVLVVTHDADVARQAERIVTIRDGRVLSDTAAAPKAATTTPTVARAMPDNKPLHRPRRLAELAAMIREAARALVAHKMRSFLSMLGVLIGTAAVIAVLALGRGAKKDVQDRIGSLGANLLVLHPGRIETRGIALEAGAVSRLTLEDAETLKREVSGIRDTAPTLSGAVQATFGGRNWRTRILGTTPPYAAMRNLPLTAGRFLSDEEVRTRARVAVIGSVVARELLGGIDPIGQTLRINRIGFEVVGLLGEIGGGFRTDPNDQIIIPITTAMRRVLGRDFVDSIEIQAENGDVLGIVQTNAVEFLRKRKRIPAEETEPFRVFNMADVQRTITETSRTLSWLLTGIGAISLLVGGIGIMNIMLVSVTERTREIGIRKAVGATQKDVLLQFIIESITISACGGAIGILLGWSISLAMSRIAGWPVSVTWGTVVLASAFSVLVGLVFGLWPARRAAALHPIEALRYE